MDNKIKTEDQDKTILEFLERVAKRAEKETEVTGWDWYVDEGDDDDEDSFDGVYVLGNKSLNPSMVVEVNVNPGEILVFIYNYNSVLHEILKEELPETAKELNIDIDNCAIA